MNVITVDRKAAVILNHKGVLREQDVNLYRRKFAQHLGHFNANGIRVEVILEDVGDLPLWP